MELVKQIKDYLDREAERPLPCYILRQLGELRNQEEKIKRAMWPPRRVIKRRLSRPTG